MLEGGSSRSEAGKKLRAIEAAVHRRLVEKGAASELVALTLAHQSSLSEVSRILHCCAGNSFAGGGIPCSWLGSPDHGGCWNITVKWHSAVPLET